MSDQIKMVFRMNKGINGDGATFQNKQDRLKYQAVVKMIPGEIKMTIEAWNEAKEKEHQRTQSQNKYYHKLLDIICADTGDVHLELHDKFKAKFLGRPYVLDDKEYIIVPSTTSLNSKNFGDYLEKIFAFASEELGIVLPSPSDYYQ